MNAQQLAHEAARRAIDPNEPTFHFGSDRFTGRRYRSVQRAVAIAWLDANAEPQMAALARKWLALICAVEVSVSTLGGCR